MSCNDSDVDVTNWIEESSNQPAHIVKIRAEREKLGAMEESLLPKITEQYNLELSENSGWEDWAQNCLTYRDVFEEVEYLTGYPAAFVAGFAMHESAGCKMNASDWAGGRGFMQLTKIDKNRHVYPAAEMLNIERSQVRYNTDPLHNLLVGICVLDDYERRLGSRPHGMLAYNMGVGGVRKYARKTGWKKSTLPEIVVMKPHLRYDKKAKPRIYVQKIAAAVIFMDKTLRGELIERKEDGYFTSDDIPGWDPANDGENVITETR